jgi:DNA helicase HerA-like ATPase
MKAASLTGRVDTFRSLRAQAEASILPLATSLDGRRFSFQAGIDGLELRLGGYVILEGDGRATLGQVRSLDAVEADLGEVGLPGDDDTDIRTRLRIRLARGDGVILDRGVEPFHDHLARAATADEVRAWQADVAPARASLAVGTLPLAGGAPVSLDAGGFDRHTFLCGQSGSGKSYALGLVLEQLLLETDLRIVILDPNSDCARLGELREDVPPEWAERWAALAPGIRVRSAESPGDERLRLRFGELAPATQAALLRLDPVADREEYAELHALLGEARPESLSELAAADRPEARQLGLRVGNLGLEGLGVWARADAGSLLDALDDPGVRCLVVDTGSLPTREEQALVAESVLRGVWERRRERRPVLVVIDEAHNVCPASPSDVLTALATEHAVRIAGEGRKFGIYMLVATQRPQKVHENVISQCDNLVLMRLNSAADAAFIAEMFGFAPPGLIGLATDFRLGEALVAGKLSSHPAVLRFGARVAREGGGDVDAGWAAAKRTSAETF